MTSNGWILGCDALGRLEGDPSAVGFVRPELWLFLRVISSSPCRRRLPYRGAKERSVTVRPARATGNQQRSTSSIARPQHHTLLGEACPSTTTARPRPT